MKVLLLVLFSCFIFYSCISQKEVDLKQNHTVNISNCDDSVVTYQSTVVNILQRECYSCHSGGNSVLLNTYQDLKSYIDAGSFKGSLNHDAGFNPMPSSSYKVNDCDLKKINKWLNNGAFNN